METIDRRRQYHHVAERIMRALRIQQRRAMDPAGDERPHDAELYAILLAYGALLYRAGGRRKDQRVEVAPGLADLSTRFDTEFPRLRDFRNWHGHPPFTNLAADEISWTMFSDGPMALLTNHGVRPIVDVEMDHDRVEAMHRELLAALTGDLS